MMKMNTLFKPGDVAYIVPRTTIKDPDSKEYGWNDEMDQYCGEVVTIRTVRNNYYRIEEDSGAFFWLHEYIQPVVKSALKLDELFTFLSSGEVSK